MVVAMRLLVFIMDPGGSKIMHQEQKMEPLFNESIFRTSDINLDNNTITLMNEETCLVESNMVIGRIIGVSSDSTYRRIWLRKVFDKLIYGQRMSDTCNTIVVRCKEYETIKDIHIYLYGRLSGGISELKMGSAIKVTGKFDFRNRFMARSLLVDSVKIGVQYELLDITIWLVPILIILLYMLGITVVSSASKMGINNDFWMKEFIAFLGGFSISLKLIKKLLGYYVPFGKRIKWGTIAGFILMIIIAFI